MNQKELGNKEENQLILTRLFGNTFGKLAGHITRINSKAQTL
jgi:hypothetical protein